MSQEPNELPSNETANTKIRPLTIVLVSVAVIMVCLTVVVKSIKPKPSEAIQRKYIECVEKKYKVKHLRANTFIDEQTQGTILIYNCQ